MLTPETSSFFAGVAARSIQYDKHNHDIHCKTLHFLTPWASSFFAGVAARSIQYEKKKNWHICRFVSSPGGFIFFLLALPLIAYSMIKKNKLNLAI